MHPLHPYPSGHALLVPKASGYASLIDMPADVAAEVLKELPRLARLVKEATAGGGAHLTPVPPFLHPTEAPHDNV